MIRLPTKTNRFTLLAGSGTSYVLSSAIDSAYVKMGIGDQNLITIDTLPPGATEAEGVDELELVPGDLTLAFCSIIGSGSFKPGVIIRACVAVGLPEDSSLPGVIRGYSTEGGTDEECAERCCEIAGDAFHKRGYKKVHSFIAKCANVIVPDDGVVAAVAACVLG